MAIVKNNTFGNISGKIGKKVFRNMYGKSTVSERPLHYVTKSELLIQKRNIFGDKSKFAKTVYGFEPLTLLWDYIFLKKCHPFKNVTAAYRLILKYNSQKHQTEFPSEKNIITPPGFKPPIEDVYLTNDCLTIRFLKGLNRIDSPAECIAIILFVNEEKKILSSEKFITNFTGFEEELVFKLTKRQQKPFSKFKEYFLYSAIVLATPDKKFRWSSTFAQRGNLIEIEN